MTTPFDPTGLSMTEIIRLQTLLSQELTRRFERTAALVFTDIVDSTAYFARYGDEAGRQMQQLHFDLIERCALQHGGRVVDTAGDGAFACFDSAPAAARAMTALQNLVSQHNVDRARPRQMCLRIGLHWGRVLSDGDQVTGDAVNLAARVAATAQPCQIRLSREMFQELDVGQRQACRLLGAVPLKGIARPVELMSLQWRDPALFPSLAVVRESGERIHLPALDTLCFGRQDVHDVGHGTDVVLAHPDATACKQISRRQFELLARPEGYVLKALSTQATEVDGVRLERDQERPLRPGSKVRLAGGVMTIDFLSPGAHEQTNGDWTIIAAPTALR